MEPRIWTEERPGGEPAPADRAEAVRDLREYHRWRRRLRWRWFGWPHLLINLLLVVVRPLLAVPGSLGRFRTQRRSVVSKWGVRAGRQILRQFALLWRYGLSPGAYYSFRLYEPDRLELAPLFVPEIQIAEVHAGLFGWHRSPFDKEEYDRRCRSADLPVIPILATCPPHGDPVLHDPDSPLWDGDLFTKHSTGGTGVSQRLWRRAEDGSYSDGTDRVADVAELLRLLCDEPKEHRSLFFTGTGSEIVQPFVCNHPTIEALSSGALATARLTGITLPHGRGARILEGIMKLPVGSAVVDNRSKGSVGAVIDLETGRLGPGLLPGEDGLGVRVDEHPETGRPIEGVTLPDWERVVEYVTKAHDLFPEAPSLGWDVAFTPDGPVLVECNVMWGSVQRASGRPLGATPFPRWTVEWLEERFGTP